MSASLPSADRKAMTASRNIGWKTTLRYPTLRKKMILFFRNSLHKTYPGFISHPPRVSFFIPSMILPLSRQKRSSKPSIHLLTSPFHPFTFLRRCLADRHHRVKGRSYGVSHARFSSHPSSPPPDTVLTNIGQRAYSPSPRSAVEAGTVAGVGLHRGRSWLKRTDASGPSNRCLSR